MKMITEKQKDFYQVKFRWEGEWKYGFNDRWGDKKEAAKAHVQNCLLIEDAITPQRYIVPVSDVVPIDIETFPNEFTKFVDAQMDEAIAKSNSLDGLQPGKLFRIGVGDGYAWYVVVKVNKKTCKIEWRGFCGDRWYDHWFGIGGTFSKSKIASYVEYEDGMRKLFGKKAV